MSVCLLNKSGLIFVSRTWLAKRSTESDDVFRIRRQHELYEGYVLNFVQNIDSI